MLNNTEFHIFENISEKEFIEIRKCIISLILATDMNNHFSELGKLKSIVSLAGKKFQI